MGKRIFIAGANGGIGRQVVEQGLRAGHRITALVRNPAKLPLHHPNLRIVCGDVMLPKSFAPELAGHDVVVSALGVSGGGLFSDKPTTLYSQGCANLLEAMKQNNMERFFCISASALDVSPGLPWFYRLVARYVIQKLLKHMYADLRLMEAVVKASRNDWTIIRPPQLTDGPLTSHYRVEVNGFLKSGLKISRAEVAHFILNHLADERIYKSTVEIAY